MNDQDREVETPRASALAGELRVVLGKLNRRLREAAQSGDFTASQKSVLLHLEREGPATVTTLAHLEGVRPQSIGATVAALEAAGFVSGTPDPTDGRQTLLSLTDACRELIEAGRTAREDWLYRAIETHLSRDEQKELANTIGLLKRLVGA
jgi:DNA-binding MarR family transcriptional regulator